MENNGEKKTVTQHSAWKLAFLTLVGLIILSVGWLFWKVSGTGLEGNKDELAAVEKPEGISLIVSLDNTEVTAVAKEYLDASKEYSDFALEVTDGITLTGKTEIFGLPIPFALAGAPYATEAGNLQVKVDDITLGGLPLPKRESLGLLADAVALPDAISIDPEAETVVILLNAIQLPKEMSIRLLNIDKQTKEYSLEVSIPVENLIE